MHQRPVDRSQMFAVTRPLDDRYGNTRFTNSFDGTQDGPVAECPGQAAHLQFELGVIHACRGVNGKHEFQLHRELLLRNRGWQKDYGDADPSKRLENSQREGHRISLFTK